MVQHNKTALVTGASRGIGRATAAALARAGGHVLVHYGRSAREAESLVSEIETKGGLANAISADLGTPNGAALLAKQVRSIVGDRLDLLVLNAGISKAARLGDYTVAGKIVAESTRTLRLEEKGYPPVYYLPRDDAEMSLLVRTKHYTYCPY